VPGRHSLRTPRIIRIPDGSTKGAAGGSSGSLSNTVDTAGESVNRWKPEERDMRAREVRATVWGTRLQFLISLAALATAIGAIVAALQAVEAVDVAQRGVRAVQRGVQVQADESRVSTAINAVGAKFLPQRVAGFTFLRRHIEAVMDRAVEDGTERSARDALSLYEGSLDVFENYIKNPIPITASERLSQSADSKLGVGRPDVPSDVLYAANDLRELLELTQQRAIHVLRKLAHLPKEDDQLPAVDLSNAQLYRKSWSTIDFSWLETNYSPNIDLRGANLTDSRWNGSTLSGAHLQCANLNHAHFNQASLVNADFRGANLYATDLRGADLEGADFTDARMVRVKVEGAEHMDSAIGLRDPLAVFAPWRLEECLENRMYWAKPDPGSN
jgi:hypothetical protein